MQSKDAKICVLVAHDPKLDPRVGWVHSTLVKFGEVSTYDLSVTTEAGGAWWREIFIIMKTIGVSGTLKAAMWLSIGLFVEIGPVILWATVTMISRALGPVNERAGRALLSSLQRLKKHLRLRPARAFIFGSRLRSIFRSARYVRTLASEIRGSVIYCHDFETLWAGLVASKLTESPIIFDAHEFYSFADVDSRFWEIGFWLVLEKSLTSKAKHKLTVSPSLAKVMAEQLLGRWATVCNAIPRASGLEVQPLAVNSTTRFVYLGRYAPGRGLEKMIDGFLDGRIENATLAIRAPACRELSELKSRVQQLDVSFEKVQFLPAVPEEDLVSSLAGFDVGFIPYLPIGPNNTHCCPNKLSQYLGAGLAVICADLEFVKSYVVQKRCGASYSGAADFVQVVQLFCNEGRLKQFRHHAIEAFQNDFNWEIQSRPLEAILSDVMR